MELPATSRLFSIGEFAAATQLTRKALRLYDDQGLLRPAITDASNGYRYYRAEQVSAGRLIRSLRDMNLSLTQIAQLLDSDRAHRELLLREFLREAEQRLARERAAYQAALLMMHSRTPPHSATITESAQTAQIVSVWDLVSDRRSFRERYLDLHAAALRSLRTLGSDAAADSSCVLLEPLTDDETRLELLMPIWPSHNPHDVTIRHLPARRYACVKTSASPSSEEFAAAIDAIFDWFDRRGAQALGHPEVMLDTHDQAAEVKVRWAFTTGESHRGNPP